MVGHYIRSESFFKIISEEKLEGKREKGRPRRSYMDQVKEEAGVVMTMVLRGTNIRLFCLRGRV